MIVTCEKCAARYKLDDAKVSGRGAKITCPKCRHVFVVYREDEKPATPQTTAPTTLLPDDVRAPAQPAERGLGQSVVVPPISGRGSTGGSLPPPSPVYTPSAPAQSAAKRDVHALDFRKVGISSWKVRVKIGLIYDFSDYKTLRKYIQDGRVTASDLLSYDAKSWVPIGDIPDLETYFIETWEAAERKRKAEEAGASSEENPFADESPTAVVGMSDLAASSLAGNLASAPAPAPAPARSATPTLPPMPAPSGASRSSTPTLPPMLEPTGRATGRSASRAQPTLPPQPAPVQKKEKSGLGLAGGVVVLVVVAALGGWAWLNFFHEPPAPPRPQPEPAQAEAAPAQNAEDIRARMRAELQAELQAAAPEEPAVIEPEPTLIPVKPKDRGSSPGTAVAPSTAPSSGGGVITTTSGAKDHAAVGDDAWRSGDYGTAATAYRQAAALEPSNATYQGKLGRALYRTGDLSGAAAALSKASKGGWTEASKWLGHIARDQGDVAGAIGLYNDYLKTTPSDAAEIQREIDKLAGS